MVSAAAQVQPAQIQQSPNQASSPAGVCVSFLPQQKVSPRLILSVLLFLYKLLSLM